MLALEAPAKINWFLRVRGKRPDGYHEIESLVQCISLFDGLTFEESRNISVLTEAPIAGDENLVTRAAVALREAAKTTKGARIGLIKRIPMAAGLGGGSSDAAAALVGLNKLWGLELPTGMIREIALGLGSDVPFFLENCSAVVAGRGEKVLPAKLSRSYFILLLNPGFRVSAGWAYSELQRFSGEVPDYASKFLEALDEGDFDSLRKLAVNDLEEPVARKYPAVAELKAKLYENGALFGAMSGSGPTVFGVFEERDTAERAESSIRAHWSAVAETMIHSA